MSELMPEQWQKNVIAFHISREMALDYGLVGPTPEEAAEREESLRKWRIREAKAWEVFDAMVPKLDALTDRPSRAVLDLHRCEDTTWPTCAECYIGDDRAPWPCSTVSAVAKVHDIETPEIELWRRPQEPA